MRKKGHIYNRFHLVSAILMTLALFWLTVSTPYVFKYQQEMAKLGNVANVENTLPANEEEPPNPFGNSTEEKAPNGANSFSEEYLHDNHRSEYLFAITSQYHKGENAGTYIAFHGELLVPPPNQA